MTVLAEFQGVPFEDIAEVHERLKATHAAKAAAQAPDATDDDRAHWNGIKAADREFRAACRFARDAAEPSPNSTAGQEVSQ